MYFAAQEQLFKQLNFEPLHLNTYSDWWCLCTKRLNYWSI